MPRVSQDQAILSSRLLVSPLPRTAHASRDFFGNQVDTVVLRDTHETITFTMTADVQILRAPSLLLPTLTSAQVAEAALESHSLASDSPAHFLAPTIYTATDNALRNFAETFFLSNKQVGAAALEMAQAIAADFAYDAKATSVETPATEALAQRRGVCQDFAHIMIAAGRSLGIPMRYVSGYIRTEAPAGQDRLQGADAMHAWISVWTGPNTGWIDYDPTNACQVWDDHITVAVGRDYRDVPPVRGSVVGGGEQSHTVAVDVVEAQTAA